jgi:aminopeptidase
MDDAKLAHILVNYSTAVQAGEIVSLIGPPAVEPAILALYREVLGAGGHPLVLMQPEACDGLRCQHGNAEQLAFVDPVGAREVEVADVAIHVLPVPSLDRGAVDPQRLAMLHASRRPLLDRFLQRIARRELRWTATVVPRQPSTVPDDWQRQLVRAMRLDHPDPVAAWAGQHERQARLIGFLEQVRELRFTAPAGTDLTIGVTGCRWHNGDGHENFPDGEVWTVPVEETIEGTVVFDSPAELAGHTLQGIRLSFRAGRVVAASATEGESLLGTLLASDPGARQVGEIGLGCNFAITQRLGHPLLDEKTGGTFHLGLGDALRGGGSRSAIHLDLIGDLRSGGRIVADGQTISADGRFVDPAWPL